MFGMSGESLKLLCSSSILNKSKVVLAFECPGGEERVKLWNSLFLTESKCSFSELAWFVSHVEAP